MVSAGQLFLRTINHRDRMEQPRAPGTPNLKNRRSGRTLHGFHPYTNLSASAAFGAATAAFLDRSTSADHSMINGLAALFAAIIAGPIPPAPSDNALALSALTLVLTGGASVYYFKPLSLKGAFACGFSVAAAIGVCLR